MVSDPGMPAATLSLGAGKVVLVVEDDTRVRRLAVHHLAALGFRVLEAGDGAAALAELRAHPEVDVLYSDLVMPGPLSGLDLARQAQRLYPGLRIVLTSGYSAELAREEEAVAGLPILRKPYRLGDLVHTLREVLSQPAPGPPTASA